jgi:hypothetical protein
MTKLDLVYLWCPTEVPYMFSELNCFKQRQVRSGNCSTGVNFYVRTAPKGKISEKMELEVWLKW